MRIHGQFFGEFPVTENFDPGSLAVSETRFSQDIRIHPRPFIELVQRLQVNWKVPSGVAGIVKTALGNAADQRHLASFEADSNGTSRAGRLAFAATPAGFAVAAGLALTQALAPMLGAGTRFQIV